MLMPSRRVRSAQTPSTRPKTNRPGNSTQRKWIEREEGGNGNDRDRVVEAADGRALQQAAVHQLLDDRRADHDDGDQADQPAAVGLVVEIASVALDSRIG